MSEYIDAVIKEFDKFEFSYFTKIKQFLKEKLEEQRKRLMLDEKGLYKFLKSEDGCNTEWINSDWADCVNLPKLAKAIITHQQSQMEKGNEIK